MKRNGRGSDPAHYLLTVLGLKPQTSRYRLGDREQEALLAPVALLDLLPEADRPDSVLALCTKDAEEETWPELKRLLEGKAPCDVVPIPAGDRQEHVDEFLKTVAERIPPGATRLTLDVTHGFRHFSFLTYMAGLFLSALSGLEIRGAYYGLLQRDVPVSPFLDLRPLLELPGWLHALEELEETGSARALARRLGPPAGDLKKPIDRLHRISTALISGLPLELGHEAGSLLKDDVKPLTRALRTAHRLPRAEAIMKKLTDILEPFKLPPEGQGWKGKMPLERTELERQSVLVSELWARGSYPAALRLMREWTVSWALLGLGRGEDWLTGEARHWAESRLWALCNLAADKQLSGRLSQEQLRLGKFWQELAELRNAFAHNGMRPQDLFERETRSRLESVKSDWTEVLAGCPELSLEVDFEARELVLVCPLGNRPGVLFSAVRACSERMGAPGACLVVCSKQSEPWLGEALSRAGYSGQEPIALRFEDPHGGLREIDELVSRARPVLASARQVAVNLTGGTTLMGLACSALAREARNLARTVEELGLVDRRSPAEQEEDPYQPGEALWLQGGKHR